MFDWKHVSRTVIAPHAASPRVLRLRDGRLIAAAETARGIRVFAAEDDGAVWRDVGQGSFAPDLTCANPELFELPDGVVLLAYRAIGKRDDGFYTSLRISAGDGETFAPHSVVAEYTEPDGGFRGVWEPCLGMLEGELTCFYANDSTLVTPMQNIESKRWNGEAWVDRTVICDGRMHDSRDGMPVWTELGNGGYALVIEATHLRREAERHPFVICLLTSADGRVWSEPREIYIPSGEGSKAGAPWIAETKGGRLVVSFQTDEDKAVKGDRTSVMKTMISNGTPADELDASDFSPVEVVFDVPEDAGALWTAVYSDGETLFASAGTPEGAVMKKIPLGRL